MGPPMSAARWPIGDSATMTDAEKQEYYEEALGDAAEALGVTPQKLKEGINKTDFSYFNYHDRYGHFNRPEKEIMVQQFGHLTPEEYKNTLRHEILHSAGAKHSKPKLKPSLVTSPDYEQFYHRPALMQPTAVNPETGRREDMNERPRKQIKLLKEFGVNNPEQVLAETLMANELFGHGQSGMAKNPPPPKFAILELLKKGIKNFYKSDLEDQAQALTEKYGPEWELNLQKIQRLRERAYPKKGKKNG